MIVITLLLVWFIITIVLLLVYLSITMFIYVINYKKLIYERDDKWIGLYHDRRKKIRYIFLIPFIGIKRSY